MTTKTIIHKTRDAIRPVAKIVNNIGVSFLSLMMVLIVLDVCFRSLFNFTLLSPYVYESIELMMVVLVFCSLGWCELNEKNICVDVLVSRLPVTLQGWINSISYFFCTAFGLLVAWRSFIQVGVIKKTNAVAIFLGIPIYPFMLIVACGFVLLCVILFLNFLSYVTRVLDK